MKKYILIFIVIILPLTCLAGSIEDMRRAVIMRKNAAAGGEYDYCTPLVGTFYWDGDHPSGTDYGCVSGTTLQAAETDGTNTVNSDYNHTTGDGSYANSVDVDEADASLKFATSGIFDIEEGSLSFWMYPEASTGDTHIFSSGNETYAFNNRLHIYYDQFSNLKVYWESGDGGRTDLTCGIDPVDGQWNHIKLQWSHAATTLRVSSDGGNNWTTNSSATTAAGTTNTYFWIGNEASHGTDYNEFSDTFHIDDVQIWTSYNEGG